jgi:hypothetical protein
LLIVDDNANALPPVPTSTPPYLPPSTQKPALLDMSYWQQPTGAPLLNQPGDVTVPQRRFGMAATVGKVYGYPALNTASSPASLFPRYQTLAEQLNPGNTTPAPDQAIDDLLLSDVLSFEIKADWDAPTGQTSYSGNTLLWPALNGYASNNPATQNNSLPRPPYFIDTSGNTKPLNPDYPFDDLPAPPRTDKAQGTDFFVGARVFDTWSRVNTTPFAFQSPPDSDAQEPWNSGYMTDVSPKPQLPRQATTIPLRMRIRALQIRIRIWDAKSQQTRQITIVQDM